VVHPEVIGRRLEAEAPFLATELVLMAAVRAGGDRQSLHERLRSHAWAARQKVAEGGESDLADRIAQDPAFAAIRDRLDEFFRKLAGRAPQQVGEFLRSVVRPILRRESRRLGLDSKLRV